MTQKVDLAQIKFDRRNANKGSERGRDAIEHSIREFGFADAGTLDKNNTIIGGNKRTEVAGEIGMDEAIIVDVDGTKPVFIRRNDLSLDDPNDDRARRLAYALNRSQEVSLTWDVEQLLADAQSGIDLSGMFSQNELDEMLAGLTPPMAGANTDPQIDKAEELRQKWQTETGQLWQLGQHRLIVGDCTDRAVAERLMDGQKASIVFTDPPYGVAIGAKNRMLNSFQPSGRNLTDIVDDEASPEDLKRRLQPAFELIKSLVMAEDCTVFMTAPQGGDLGMMMMMMMRDAGLPIRHVLIWKKNAPTFSMGRLDYDYQHEPILLTWGKRHKRPMSGQHKTSVWEIDKPRASAEHPTMKPVELYENAYLNNSDSGDVAYEPYAGSGTAFIAAHNLNRRCYGCEISPAYCAVILQRWADHTGQQPVLIA